jgi:hypothetical protein
MKNNQKRDFKGVWIPKEIWTSQYLTLQEKVFLTEIDSLDNKNGCFAGNEYFANFFQLSKDRCSEVINSLKNKGFLKIELNKKSGKTKRKITIHSYDGLTIFHPDTTRRKHRVGIGESAECPLGENTEYNNTSINNTNNISFPSGKVKKKKSTSLQGPDPILKHSAADLKKPPTRTPDEVSLENGINVPPPPQTDAVPQNLASGSVPAETFDQKKEIKKLVEGYADKNGVLQKPKPNMVIIGLLIMAQGIQLESKEQLSSIIQRNLRSAKLLEPYSIKRIIQVMKYLHDNVNFKWGLETVSKYIDYDLTKIKPINNKETSKVFGEDVKI